MRVQYIVQSSSVQAARESVARAGGEVTRELSVINAVAADLSDEQTSALRLMTGIRLIADRRVMPLGSAKGAAGISLVLTDGTAVPTQVNKFPTNYPMLVGADTMQQGGINGKGVTIAVLDTGLWNADGQKFDKRVLASIDVTNGGSAPVTADPYGHGTHVTSIAAGGAIVKGGSAFDITPNANLVIVRAFDADGVGSYADVIAGID